MSDLGGVRDQKALFWKVASDSTAFRVVDRIASDPGLLEAVRAGHARARERFWALHGAPERLTIDIDATLITAHSEKEKAAGNYKARVRVFSAAGLRGSDARGPGRDAETGKRRLQHRG